MAFTLLRWNSINIEKYHVMCPCGYKRGFWYGDHSHYVVRSDQHFATSKPKRGLINWRHSPSKHFIHQGFRQPKIDSNGYRSTFRHFFFARFFSFMLGGVRSVVVLCCRWRHGRRCIFVACVGRQTIYVLPVEKHCIFGKWMVLEDGFCRNELLDFLSFYALRVA